MTNVSNFDNVGVFEVEEYHLTEEGLVGEAALLFRAIAALGCGSRIRCCI